MYSVDHVMKETASLPQLCMLCASDDPFSCRRRSLESSRGTIITVDSIELKLSSSSTASFV